MLVVSRRENDRVVFPTLGITVEVKKLTRSRASLGITAPKGIRVLRHEVMERDPSARCETNLIDSVKQAAIEELKQEVQLQVEEATRRLADAQELLKVGDAEAAFECIAVALAELDSIAPAQTTDEIANEHAGPQSSGNQTWTTADTVAESSSAYQIDSVAAQVVTVRYPEDDFHTESLLLERLRYRGYRVVETN